MSGKLKSRCCVMLHWKTLPYIASVFMQRPISDLQFENSRVFGYNTKIAFSNCLTMAVIIYQAGNHIMQR